MGLDNKVRSNKSGDLGAVCSIPECEQMASRKTEIGFGASCGFTRP